MRCVSRAKNPSAQAHGYRCYCAVARSRFHTTWDKLSQSPHGLPAKAYGRPDGFSARQPSCSTVSFPTRAQLQCAKSHRRHAVCYDRLNSSLDPNGALWVATHDCLLVNCRPAAALKMSQGVWYRRLVVREDSRAGPEPRYIHMYMWYDGPACRTLLGERCALRS